MKKFLIATILIVLFVSLMVGAVLLVAPAGPVTSWITQRIEGSTGRSFSVQGTSSLKLLPRIVWRIEDVVLSSPPGLRGDPFLRANTIEVHGHLPSLLWSYFVRGRVELDLIRVDEARLELVTHKEGRKSWDFVGSASGPGPSMLLALHEININGGSIAYRDEASGMGGEVRQVRAVAKQAQVGGPITTEFEFDWNEDKIAGTGSLGSLEALTKGTTTTITVELTARHGRVGVEGELTRGDAPKLTGRASGATPSLSALAAWMRFDPPTTASLGAATVDGQMDWQISSGVISFKNGRISWDKTKAQGDVAIDYRSTPLLLSGTISADRLDIGRYVPGLNLTRTRPPRARTADASVLVSELDPALATQSLKAYLEALDTGAATGTTTRRAAPALPIDAGSDETFNVDWLKRVDLNLDFGVRTVTLGDMEVGLPKIVLGLRRGELLADVREIVTRGGRASLKTVVDARPSVPTHKTSVTATNVEALDILEDLGVTGVLTGKASLEAELSGAVSSSRQLISSLSGQLKARVNQGAIVGYDFRNMYGWPIRKPIYDPNVRTVFNRLEANVTVDDGVARSSDLQLDGPIIGGNADGTAQLASRQLDAHARLTRHPLAFLLGTFFGRICCAWHSLKFELLPDHSPMRSLAPESTATDIERLDLDDPELAPLMKRVLENPEARRALGPAATETLQRVLQSAESRRR
jgi:uncharacterized protein involved in outer membrane biogenesis